MVSIAQIEHGIGRWVDAVLIPQIPLDIPNGNLKRLGVAASAVYLIRKGKTALMALQSNSILNSLGAIDHEGSIDLDGIKEAVMEKIPKGGIKLTVPILNEVTFYPEDIEQVYDYIMGG